jgi:hypothetical protein
MGVVCSEEGVEAMEALDETDYQIYGASRRNPRDDIIWVSTCQIPHVKNLSDAMAMTSLRFLAITLFIYHRV